MNRRFANWVFATCAANASPVVALPGFEPPTCSAPAAAPEVGVVETTQNDIERSNSYTTYLFSGEVFFEQEDQRLPGRGFDFVWKRKYRSQLGMPSPMGITVIGTIRTTSTWKPLGPT